jgi:hypothetical protein
MEALLVVVILYAGNCWAQAPDTLWTRYYGGGDDDEGIACVNAGNSSTIVTGWDASHGQGGHDVVIARVTDAGVLNWVRYVGGASNDEGYSVVGIGENQFAVGGWTTVSGVSGEFYLILINGNGDTLWTRHFGGSGMQKCYDLVRTNKTPGFAMVGYTNTGGSDDVMLLRVSATGDSLWSKVYGGTGGDVGWSIVETVDYGFLLAGYTSSYGHGDRDIYLIRTNGRGDTLWTRTYGGTSLDWAYYANNATGANYVIAGYTVSFRQSGQYNAIYLKVNDFGDTVWTSVVRSTGAGSSVGTSICQMDDGNYFVAGHGAGSGGSGAPDAFAAVLSATGSVVWSKIIGGWSSDYGREGIVKPDGAGYVIAGNTFSYGAGNSDVYVIFLDGAVARDLTVLSPNGGEVWTLGETETVTWHGSGFSGGVSLELNRDYPNGDWEFWGVFENDGSEFIIVPGPPSDQCRIRISAIDDTLSDISDTDFSIVAAPPEDSLVVLIPNGGDMWRISTNEMVSWFGSGFGGGVRIELNRFYPQGLWETLAASTPNDGFQVLTVTGPPSELCRIRIAALAAPLSDVSDTNFTIVSAQGYLALVDPAQPGAPIMVWDAGTVECPQTATANFRLKNFGDAAISVSRPLEPVSASFSTGTTCPTIINLSPGQVSTCTVSLTYNPVADGLTQDTLLIPTDAANAIGGFVRVPIFGARVSTPLAPVITINMRTADARLRWRRVNQSTGNCAVAVAQYNIFVADRADGPFVFQAATADTFYVHTGVGSFYAHRFYRVTAVN